MTINIGLSAIFEHATEGILIADAKGNILMVNPAVRRMFGYEPSELIGNPVEKLIPQRFSGGHHKHRDEYVKNPHPRPMGLGVTLYGMKKGGVEFPVEISLSTYDNKEERYIIAFIIDITERKIQEDKIKKANEELEQRVQNRTLVLNEALTQLERSKEEVEQALAKEVELNELKSRFVSMASHEFRTPLSAILSSVSLISKYSNEGDEEKRNKHITRIKSSVTHLTQILNDLLSIGKLEEGKVTIKYEEVSIVDLIKEIAEAMRGLLRPDQTVSYIHEGDLRIVNTDKQVLKNILINLISNASKYSQPGKKIYVSSNVSVTDLSVSVRDEGIGIPDRDKERMFQRFFRASNVTNIEGTGLGLSIIKRYVELLKGEITFNSVLNEGTEFKINIPL